MEQTAGRLLRLLQRSARVLDVPSSSLGPASISAANSKYASPASPFSALSGPIAQQSAQLSTRATIPEPKTSIPTSSAAAAAGSSPAAAAAMSLSPFQRFKKDFERVPAVPKVLGLAGAIPFLVLNPPTAQHLAAILPIDLVVNAAAWQVSYAACIVSFLGAVNWGAAMASPLTGEVAKRINNERYIWSVLPSLLAWPLVMMEPAPASLAFTLMLPALYVRDKQFARLGYIPSWYLSLRRVLTYAATFGMSITASYYYNKEMDRLRMLETIAKQQEQQAQQAQQAGQGA